MYAIESKVKVLCPPLKEKNSTAKTKNKNNCNFFTNKAALSTK